MKKLRLSLFVKKDKINEAGLVPVFVKILLSGQKTSMNLQIRVDDKRWKETAQFKNSKAFKEQKIRRDLNEILYQIEDIYEKLESKGMPFKLDTIKKIYLSDSGDSLGSEIMLSELFEKHFSIFKPLVDQADRAQETLRKYQTLRNHVIDFLEFEYGIEDITLGNLNYIFIEGFDTFLRSVKGIGNNTTVKYVQSLRRLMNLAVKYDWLIKDPFLLYDKKVKRKDAEFLTKDELEKIENLVFESTRLEVVRDIFVFACYTGYAPVDYQKLTYDHINKGNDGQKWIFTERQKTGVKADVPLLKKAEEIIDKYREDFYCMKTGRLLPKRSTQKMNQYLKEVGEIAGISKSMHQYLARHTFACTVILANGLSMEVLSRMLGHTNLKQTMAYGKIQNVRVGEEMKTLRKKLKE